MRSYDRRAFLACAGALTVASLPGAGLAQTACVTSGLPPFVPNRLTVDCATRRNFALYRKYATYQGLAGCVSMTYRCTDARKNNANPAVIAPPSSMLTMLHVVSKKKPAIATVVVVHVPGPPIA